MILISGAVFLLVATLVAAGQNAPRPLRSRPVSARADAPSPSVVPAPTAAAAAVAPAQVVDPHRTVTTREPAAKSGRKLWSERALSAGVGALTPRLADLAAHARVSAHAAQLGAGKGLGSILWTKDGKVIVEIRAERTDRRYIHALHYAGADVIASSAKLHTVTAAIRPEHLTELATTDGVLNVGEVLAPYQAASSGPSSPSAQAAAGCSPIVSEGDTQLKAATARSHFNVNGTGTTVGVLSDSYDKAATAPTHASDDVASGALPGTGNPCGFTTPVDVVSDTLTTSPTDEGRAMAQIVHGLAPGAKLSFATGCCSQATFAQNIDTLANKGAKVIVDDLAYLDEPVYQDGVIAAEISKVKAKGVTYIAAAGNDNVRIGGKDVGSYEAHSYRPTACPSGPPYVDCHNFAASGPASYLYGLTVAPGRTIVYDLQWAQPWYGVTTDLDLFLLNDSGVPLAGSINNNTGSNGTQHPFELVSWTNTGTTPQHVNFAVARKTGPNVRFKLFAIQPEPGTIVSVDKTTAGGGDVIGPTVFGHSANVDALSIGAVPYTSAAAAENYSSRGPATHVFRSVNGTQPASAFGAPATIKKPDVVASDCVRTTFFGTFDGTNYRFCGTSAAAPHAAAVAALGRQKLSAAGPSDIIKALVSKAVDVSPSGVDPASGSGLIDADAALGALTVLPTPTPTPTTTPTPTPTTTPTSTPTPSKSPKPAITLSTEQPKPGGLVTVKGSGFAPNTLFDIYLHSKPILLGSTPSSNSGSFSIDVFVPASVPLGAHSIQVMRASGGAVEASASLTVIRPTGQQQASHSVTTSAPARLPRTGGDVMRTFLFALFALAAGGSLILFARGQSMRSVVVAVASRETRSGGSVYAVLAQGSRALPEVTEIRRSQEPDRS